jgi:hypothetical protein
MPHLVNETAQSVRDFARSAGLIPVDGSLAFGHMPVLRWMGDSSEFIQLAKSAGAKLVYVDVVAFHPMEMIVACVAENIDDYELPDSDDGSVDMVDRLYHGLEEAVHPWLEREGEAARLVCSWVYEGVAHIWKLEQPWYVECRQAMEHALDQLYESYAPATA